MRVQSHQSLSFRHCSMIFVEIMRLFIEIHSIRTNELTRNQISLYRKLRPRQSALLEIKSEDRNFQMHINDLEFNQMCFACATFLIALCTVHSCRLWWAVPFRLRKFELFTPSVVLRPQTLLIWNPLPSSFLVLSHQSTSLERSGSRVYLLCILR
jgi:hypothetical protein